ncbi:internalin-like protein, partial [Listeria seeligeri FSL S4-171]
MKKKELLKRRRKLNKLKSGLILTTSLAMVVPSSPLTVLATEVVEEKENQKDSEPTLPEEIVDTPEEEQVVPEEPKQEPTEEPQPLTEKQPVKENANNVVIPESAWEGSSWLANLTAEKVGKSVKELTYQDLTTVTSLHYTAPQDTYVRLPAIIGNFSNLTVFKVAGLEGGIPAELANISTLSELTLNHGRLTGVIPSQIQQMESLTQIDFSDNALSGNFEDMEEKFQAKIVPGNLDNNFFDNIEGQQSISYQGIDKLETVDLNAGTVILNADGSENAEKKTRLNNNFQYSVSNGAPITGSRGSYILAIPDEANFTLNIGIERVTSGQSFYSTEVTPDNKPGLAVGKNSVPVFEGRPTAEEVVHAFEVSAYDNKDGDITSQITVSGLDEIDSNVSASYLIELTVTDSDGNVSDTQTVTVPVVAVDAIPFELWEVTVDENGAITGGNGENFSKEVLKQVNKGDGADKTISQVTAADAEAITSISFAGNAYRVGGAIPKAIGAFTNIKSLAVTRFVHGNLPEEMKGLEKLTSLNLNGTERQYGPTLSDPNHVIETLTGLETLVVAETTGTFDITNYPIKLPNLKVLKFQNAHSWTTPIKIIGNTSGFGSFSKLTNLELSGDLSGLTLDDQFYEMPLIKNLKIGAENPLSSRTDFQGEITSDITKLTTLETLTLNGLNRYTAKTLPVYFGEIPNLKSLDLSYNGFVGELPPSYDHLSTLNLSRNYLTGDYNSLNASSTRNFYGNLYDNAPTTTNQSELIVTRNGVANNNWLLGELANYEVSFIGAEQTYHTKFMNSMYEVENIDG